MCMSPGDGACGGQKIISGRGVCVCVLLRFKSKAPHITDHALPELHPSPLFIYLFVIFGFFLGQGLALQPWLSLDLLCSAGWSLTLSSPSASAARVLD